MMKKLTDFIIDKRYFVLGFFAILVLISFLLMNKVKINYDMAEYLPSDSETRIGMNIMKDEFDEEDSSSLNVMFKDLDEEEKDKIYNELLKIKGVSSVDYENTSEYNKKEYTLYVVNVSDKDDSKLASHVYDTIKEDYADYKIATSGSIDSKNNPVLPTWIVVLAVSCATVILIVMSNSYVEPFLFLTAIGIAVALNKGTNIIFPNVSNITDSITAILQMALSMDYSIMLMNRYTQEKNSSKNKVDAMKKALYNAFKSISSSSVTTIVGLLALVFMSFTIGRDLGFVLAKGVLFSLISIFFCLPGLILIFDKLIDKTKKKTLNIKLDKLGKFSYKHRYIAFGLIILVFIVSYLLKGNLGILYTDKEEDEINNIFPENNQMAIIYKNEYEDLVSKYCSNLDKEKKVDSVLCYGNTIGDELTYDELNSRLNYLGSDIEVDDDLLKIIYYRYYNKEELGKMTFQEFVNFIQDKIYNNDKMNSNLDYNTRTNIDKLSNFTSANNINKLRNTSEISNILGIDKDSLDLLMVYYNSKHTNTKMNLNTFTNFMTSDVLNNSNYSKNIDSSTKNDLLKLSNFTNSNTINSKMTSRQMASLIGSDEASINGLYNYYLMNSDISIKLSINDFSNFVINNVLTNSNYTSSIDNNLEENIKILNNFSDKNIINKNMNSSSIASLFGIDDASVKGIMLLYYSNKDNGSKLSLLEFVNYVNYIKTNTNYLDGVDTSNLDSLSIFIRNDANINTTKMDKASLAYIFNGISEGLVDRVYESINIDDSYQMTPQEFVNLVLDKLSSNMDNQTKASMELLKFVIDSSVNGNNDVYSASELASLLNMNYKDMLRIYALIDYVNGNTDNWLITPYQFTSFILNNSDNPNIKSNINSDSLIKLNLLKNIMLSSINDNVYSYQEISSLIGIDVSSAKNIYALYVFNNYELKLTPYEFVNFVLSHKNDSILSSNLSKNSIDELDLVRNIMNSTLNGYKYSYSDLAKLFNMDSSSLRLLYSLYDFKYLNNNYSISLKDFTTFLLDDVITNSNYSGNFDNSTKVKLKTIDKIMNDTLNNVSYSKEELYDILVSLSDFNDEKLVELVYIYYGSENYYDDTYSLNVEKFVNYLNDDILKDELFSDFIDKDMKNNIKSAKKDIDSAKKMLVGKNYSRVIINTKLDSENKETFDFIKSIQNNLDSKKIYVIGDSPMAYEMSKTFSSELDFITVLTMILIFIVVAITFKSIIIPLILTLIIQCAVYITMGILSILGGEVYFIALLIVQSILMGATIDYAILYTSYYLELRDSMGIKDAVINAYNKSIHTILTSSSILIIVTLIVGSLASAITSKICKTISQGTFCSIILILFILPAILASCDRVIYKGKNKEDV